MPLVIALPHHRAAPRVPSRRSLSRRSTRSGRAQSQSSRATSHVSRSTVPSTVSIETSPSRDAKGDTDITIRLRKGITVNNHTGAEYYSDEDSSGVQVLSGSQEEYSSSEETDEEDYEDEDDSQEGWDLIDNQEIQPSDSASRPHVKRHTIRAPSVPPTRHLATGAEAEPHWSANIKGRGGVGASPPTRIASKTRTTTLTRQVEGEHRFRHTTPVLPTPDGYAPSFMSDPRFHQYGGAASPAGQLVPNGYHDPFQQFGHQNPFAPNGANPFTGPPGGGAAERGGYFPEQHGGHPQHSHRPGHGRGNRNSMGAPPGPEGAIMPYGAQMGQYPPYGSPYGHPGQPGMHPGMMYPPYGYPPQQQSPPPQPQRAPSSRKQTPRAEREHEESQAPAPATTPAQMAIPPPGYELVPMRPPQPPPIPSPPAVDTAKEDGMLSKLEKLLLQKEEDEKNKAEEERKAAENAKFDRLEKILLSQQEAKIEKEKLKAKAAEDAKKAAAEAKKKGDEDKLEKLEKLILAQKDEQLKREAALEAQRAADKKEKDEEAAKVAAEKQAAAEKAKYMLDAAKARRKAAAEAEEIKKAHEKAAEEAKQAHEKAIAEAKAAAEELEKAKKAAEEEAARLKPSDAPKAPIKFKDAVGRKFSFPWNLCKTWKGMEELIKQAFLHVDVIGPHVHEGHYDLVGPDGEIILPQVWETMIQPDWAITMHMWPMPEPPPPPPEPKPVDPYAQGYPPPPPDMAQFHSHHMPVGKSKSLKNKDKVKLKRSSMPPMMMHHDPHVVQVPPMPSPHGAAPPPPPPPPHPGMQGVPPPPPAVMVMPQPSQPKPRKKSAPAPFFRWAAGPAKKKK
ncbi:hypothetical protein SNOG_03439 [Parastagonospora nodorum SN15]|uniref:Ubiquitin-like domain-containing protein n=1 Tax=Phaeosphaeria nodorum (strain SN15 / ATCC MYA-4574 / FGSC 10173) TaxID=321614 RepID=Q0UXS5_PHANO|nr:hypothetical protein SNOG_03439 [Parastagonospora nodorum SN15]EAT88644.2 hypothetical protein SNOG_03439 [Parastagonospora nodorum SN15]